MEGQNTVIKQIVHIASNTTEVLLSIEAYKQLGLTTEQLPKSGMEPNGTEIKSTSNGKEDKEPQHTSHKGITPLQPPTETLGKIWQK